MHLNILCINVDFSIVSGPSTRNNKKRVIVKNAEREYIGEQRDIFDGMTAIERMTQVKLRKHGTSSSQLGMKFMPFIIEEHGHIGYDGHRLMNIIKKHLRQQQPSTNASIISNHIYTLL